MTDMPTPNRLDDSGAPRRDYRHMLFIGALSLAFVALSVDVIDDILDFSEELEFGVVSTVLGLTWQMIAACGLGLAIAIIYRDKQRRALQDARSAQTLALMRGELHAVMQNRFADWGLTSAEKDVAHLILKGMTGAEISQARATAPGTVRAQSSAIFRKAGVTARAEFLALFLDEFLGVEPGRKVPGADTSGTASSPAS